MNTDFIGAIPVPALVISADDTLADCNLAFRNLFPQTQIGRSYLTVLRQANLVSLVEDVRSGMRRDSVLLAINGKAKGSFRATGSILGDTDVLICLQDVNETAMAIEIRRNFLADLSHELKTPLTAISGILETCQNDVDAVAQFLPLMSSEVGRMNSLVADLLTLYRVQDNERRTPTQEIVLQTVVAEACTPLAVLAEQSGQRIETAMLNTPIRFQGDRSEIFRAISNLVENAIHYSDAGGVVSVSGQVIQRDQTSGGPSVSIQVSDTGIGVEDHHIPRLTERFYRVDDHRSRVSGGSGLGLAIVKHIVTHHRGRMTFESKRNEGSIVTLVLPLSQVG